jgi:Tfp pilus assembly protein PilO
VMGQLRWLSARLTHKLGVLGWLSVLILVAIVLYGFQVVLADRQRLDRLSVLPVPAKQTQQQVTVYHSPAEQFFAQTPASDNVTSQIQTIFNVAESHHIVINEVIYTDEQKPTDKAIRYAMHFSVIASYIDIKTFIVNVIAALPFLALDQLTFEREQSDSNVVTAHIQFTMYLVHK